MGNFLDGFFGKTRLKVDTTVQPVRTYLKLGSGLTLTDDPTNDQGILTASGGGSGGTAAPVASVAALKALTTVGVTPDVVDGQTRYVTGDPVAWKYDASSGAGFAGDDTTFARPSDVSTPSNGRWYRATSSPVLATIAALRLAVAGGHATIQVQAFSAQGDNGGGTFDDVTSTFPGHADDDGVWIRAAGRVFKRRFAGAYQAAWFGASLASADNTAAVNAAELAVFNAGGGELEFPQGGALSFLGQLIKRSGVNWGPHRFDWTGAVAASFPVDGLLDSAGADAGSKNCITGKGSLVDLGTLSGTATAGSRTLAMTTPTGAIAKGTRLLIWNSADYSYSPYRTYYRAGEAVEVLSVSGSTITLIDRLHASYASGATIHVYKVVPITFKIRDPKWTGFSTTDLVMVASFAYAVDCVIDNPDISGSDYALLTFKSSHNCVVNNPKLYDNSTPSGYQYGLLFSNCQDCHAFGGRVATSRIATDLGGGAWVGTIVNRRCSFNGMDLAGNGLGLVSSANMHGNTELCEYNDCTPSGYYVSGRKNTFKGGTCFAGSSLGEAVVFTEVIAMDHVFSDIDVYATTNVDASTGLIALVGQDNVTDAGSTLIFDDVRLHMGAFTGKPWKFQNSSSLVTASVNSIDFDLDVSVFADSANSATFCQFFNVSGRAFRKLKLRGTFQNVHLLFDQVQFQEWDIGVSVHDATAGFGIQIAANPNATSVWATQHIKFQPETLVRGSKGAGILVTGQLTTASARTTTLDTRGITTINNAQTPVGNATDTGIYGADLLQWDARSMSLGDDQTPPTQTNVAAGAGITELYTGAWLISGTVRTTAFTSVGNQYTATERLDAIGVANLEALALVNHTDAAAGAQQNSPGFSWWANGWKTNATAGSQACRWFANARPVQGAANPTVDLYFASEVNSGGLSTGFIMSYNGDFHALGSIYAGSAVYGPSSIVFGGTVASVGDIRVPNTFTIQARNAANSGDVVILSINGGDDVSLVGKNSAQFIQLRSDTDNYLRGQKWLMKDTGGTTEFEFDCNGTKFGAFGATAVGRQTVTGSRGGNEAVASLLTAMANFGWITDGSSA